MGAWYHFRDGRFGAWYLSTRRGTERRELLDERRNGGGEGGQPRLVGFRHRVFTASLVTRRDGIVGPRRRDSMAPSVRSNGRSRPTGRTPSTGRHRPFASDVRQSFLLGRRAAPADRVPIRVGRTVQLRRARGPTFDFYLLRSPDTLFSQAREPSLVDDPALFANLRARTAPRPTLIFAGILGDAGSRQNPSRSRACYKWHIAIRFSRAGRRRRLDPHAGCRARRRVATRVYV